MAESQRHNSDVPHDLTRFSAAAHALGGMLRLIRRAAKRTIEFIDRPQPVPPELEGFLTMEQVREALQIYLATHQNDYNQPVPSNTPLWEIELHNKLRMDLPNDFYRKVENMIAIFEIHFGVDMQKMNPQQKLAMESYCRKLVGVTGANL